METKKILIVPVNFNSYDELESFLKSCDIAYNNINNSDLVELFIFVADNSTIPKTFNSTISSKITFNIFKQANIGYLNGAINIINSLNDIETFDYIIISNVDLNLEDSFFIKLLNSSYNSNIGWIAPSILSMKEKRDKNPKILKRYTKEKLRILYFLYRYPILHKIYEKTLYRRKKVRPLYKAQSIYAGHGSIIILTGKALSRMLPLCYPVFLFGEECFLAEKLREVKMTVFYDPNIKVIDHEHASTGKMKSKFYYKCNAEALSYIISEFYE